MKKAFYGAIVLLISLFLLFLVVDFLYPLDEGKLSRPQSVSVSSQSGEVLRFGLSKDGYWRFDANETEVPMLLKKSVLLFEDRYFYYHFGVNPLSILRAVFHNAKGSSTIGASTISMQVARMMQRRKRSYKNKLIEMFNALQLEWHFSKDEILNFYLNLAPYGGNIEGVKAASYFYFKKAPIDLTIAQIALLTTIPKNPNVNRLDKKSNLLKKRTRVLNLLYKNSLISKSALLRANIEPINKKRFQAPFLAPHYTNIALKNRSHEVKLDMQKQRFLERLIKNAVAKLNHLDVKNGAAVLIDNRTMEIKAYVGSQDFYAPLGQNDGVKALRSPGSTLKPFIYANALDEGLITPERLLFDVPLHVGFYEPENFYKSFFGQISAKEALQYSLNIPAVELNMLLGENSLYESLKKAGVSSVDESKEYYGDSIALGGFGISLLDLTHLYTIFANDGVLRSLKVAGKSAKKDVNLTSPQSAWLVSEILADGIRPELSEFWQSAKDIPKIGFKTGTSADSKDLYTVGFTKDFTLGVWLGNFDGSKTQDLSGIQSASKVVFNFFRQAQKEKNLTWMSKPKTLMRKPLCVDSILGSTCVSKKSDFVIKGVDVKHSCKVLRGEVYAYMIDTNMIKSIDELSSNPCYYEWKEKKPALIYPYDGAKITVGNFNKIMLKCYSFNDDKSIYFKIDDEDLVKSQSGKEVFKVLGAGLHEITCIDSASKASTSTITIKESK